MMGLVLDTPNTLRIRKLETAFSVGADARGKGLGEYPQIVQ